MPFTYAVGQSFHNANETIVRCVALAPGARYFGTRNSAGFVTLPTLDTGVSYTEIQGIQNLNWSKSDKDQKFRLIGDGGWEDSRKTGAGWQASITSFLMKDMEFSAGSNVPSFRGAYEEGYRIIELASQTADSEIYLEILQDLGQANGTTGNYIYSFTGVNCSVQNLKPGVDPQNLTNLTYDLIGRGEVISGLYDAGSTRLNYGSLQTGLLQTFNATLSTGTRRYAPVPADNATAIVVSAPSGYHHAHCIPACRHKFQIHRARRRRDPGCGQQRCCQCYRHQAGLGWVLYQLPHGLIEAALPLLRPRPRGFFFYPAIYG